jgi:hypothetical protein
MTITKAIAASRSYVQILRSGNQWVVISPHYPNKIDGPSAQSNPTDYWQAIAHATRAISVVALAIMGACSYDSAFVACETTGDVRTRVRAGLRAFAKCQ